MVFDDEIGPGTDLEGGSERQGGVPSPMRANEIPLLSGRGVHGKPRRVEGPHEFDPNSRGAQDS